MDEAGQNMRNRSTSYKSGARPIEISNNVLIDSDCNVRILPNLRENIDFEILCKEAWVDFHKWYGGGPEIMRFAVSSEERVFVEIYPPVLKVFYKKNNSSSISKEPLLYLVNNMKTVASMIEELKKKLQFEGDFCLYLKTGEITTKLESEKLFSEYKLVNVNICLFELESENENVSISVEETLKFNLDDAVEYLENGY